MPVFLGYFLATVKFNLSLDVILERSMYWMECSLLSAATDSDVIKLYDLTSICQQVWLVLYEDFRLCPHYARGIWKGSFISTVWLTVHTNPSRNTELFENALFKPLKFENAGRALYCGRKTFWKKKRTFQKRWRHDNHVISLPAFSSNTNPNWPVIVAFSSSFQRSKDRAFDGGAKWILS